MLKSLRTTGLWSVVRKSSIYWSPAVTKGTNRGNITHRLAHTHMHTHKNHTLQLKINVMITECCLYSFLISEVHIRKTVMDDIGLINPSLSGHTVF